MVNYESMEPLKIQRMYLIDTTYRRTLRRTYDNIYTPYNMIIGIDTYDSVTPDHIRCIEEEFPNLESIQVHTTLFGDLSTTFRYKMINVRRTDPKSDFDFYKKIVENDASILISVHSNDVLIKEWSKMFINLFTLE